MTSQRTAAAIAIAISVLGVMVAAAPTSAAAKPKAQSSAAVRRELTSLAMDGATDAQIRRATGLVRVAQSRGITGMSANNAVSLSVPKVYYNKKAKDYYVSASWTFSKVPPDGTGTSFDIGPVGGPDGFGVSFSHQVNNKGGSLKVCGRLKKITLKNRCTHATNYSDDSATGASWTFPDLILKYSLFRYYTAGVGSMVFTFKPLSKGCLQMFTKYAHTWSSTGLTAIGVGLYSFSYSWTHYGHQWTRSSGAGKLHC